MPPRFFSTNPLTQGECALDERAARHARVLRLDTGDAITLFDGRGGEWHARVLQTRKNEVRVEVLEAQAIERELPRQVHLAVGMPANERMDFLIEKATELGAASIQPLVTSRSVLRIAGERAAKKVAHWQAIAISACEQCGRNRVPVIHAVASYDGWLSALGPSTAHAESRVVLSPGALLGLASESTLATLVLSGPEGGLSADEEALAVEHHGFMRASLGPRVLRADTAPLAALVTLSSSSGSDSLSSPREQPR